MPLVPCFCRAMERLSQLTVQPTSYSTLKMKSFSRDDDDGGECVIADIHLIARNDLKYEHVYGPLRTYVWPFMACFLCVIINVIQHQKIAGMK